MLILTFTLLNEKLGLPVTQIVEITPFVKVKKIYKVPTYIRGLMNFRGEAIPIVDMKEYLSSEKSKIALSCGIIIVEVLHNNKRNKIGLLVEAILGTVQVDQENFLTNPIMKETASYIANILSVENDFIGLVDTQALFGEEILKMLYD